MQSSPFLAYNQDFVPFGTQHLIVLMILILSCLFLPGIARDRLNRKRQIRWSRIMSVTISFWALAYVLILVWLGDFNYRTDLPLDICNLTALLLPFLMWKPSFRVHEVLYFWVLVGTVQANLTPHLYNGFPNFIFIKYWVVHAGLVFYVVYITVVFGFYPNRRGVWRSFGYLQVYLLFIFLFNLAAGSNYVYVLHKPPTASILDYLGPWPWYILVVEVLGLAAFFLMLVPVRAWRKWESGKRSRSEGA